MKRWKRVTSITLTDAEREKLQALALQYGLSRSAMVGKLVSDADDTKPQDTAGDEEE